MTWCKHCAKKTVLVSESETGQGCCKFCGRVIIENIYSSEPTFIKSAGGQSQLAGRSVNSVHEDLNASRMRTLEKGREEISEIVQSLYISGGDSTINHAHAFYKIAVERKFTYGRRTSLVAAACLYLTCRQSSKPYLLIDFSECLQINVYVLGAVFLQLCVLLKLHEHPFVQKPVDPSLFIHRFTETLLGHKNFAVSRTALRIVASMKRDWIQTGRKPSGLCGAALYIAALAHGFKYSKSEVVSVVHVCEQTLTNRLIEFENTESAHLTVEEFIAKASESEGEALSKPEAVCVSKSSGSTEVLCEHKDKAYFAHGLCRECYNDFIEVSGGLQGGAEPPAFQRAERHRMAEVETDEKAKITNHNGFTWQDGICHAEVEVYRQCSEEIMPEKVIANELESSKDPENVGVLSEGQKYTDGIASGEAEIGGDDSEGLSDIDDDEVNKYLHSEEEKHWKKIIWEEMNKEYLEEQAVKEAAAAASRAAYEANMKNCTGDMLEAQKLADAVAAAVSKSKKEKQQKRSEEAKTAPLTAAEATCRMLTKKRLSSKINYDVLEKLFDDDSNREKRKKRVAVDDKLQHKHKEDEGHGITGNGENIHLDMEDGYGEEDAGDGYDNYSYCENQEDEQYGYEVDYDGDY